MKKRLRCNAADDAEFLEHYKFLLRELHRATRSAGLPGWQAKHN